MEANYRPYNHCNRQREREIEANDNSKGTGLQTLGSTFIQYLCKHDSDSGL